MAMSYEELDRITRKHMLVQFEAEEASASPYRSKALSPAGLSAFPDLFRTAVSSGNELTLAHALGGRALWDAEEEYTRNGITRARRRNIEQSSHRLALTEFNTFYVRGFASRLMEEGVSTCQICRGEEPKWEPGECAHHEGVIVAVQDIYSNHRVRYWPEPGQDLMSIPFAPGCHHVIRRVK
jgi:hypothetical protein